MPVKIQFLVFGERVGVRKFSLICIVIVSLAGCSGTDKIEIKGINNTQRLDTGAGMAAYLQGQTLHDLKSVEVWNNSYAPGLKLTTTHYEIFTTLLEPFVLRGISGFIESAYRAYNSQLPGPFSAVLRTPPEGVPKRTYGGRLTAGRRSTSSRWRYSLPASVVRAVVLG